LLLLLLADAVGDICSDGDEAVWGDESDVISPVTIEKETGELVSDCVLGIKNEILLLLYRFQARE
jgi:hypothetical protein